MMFKKIIVILLAGMVTSCSNPAQKQLDLSRATILVSPNIKSPVQETAGNVLIEEIAKRTNITLGISDNLDNNTIIALIISGEEELHGVPVPNRVGDTLPEFKKEGYRIFHEKKNDKDILWISGADARGVLYGIGKLLRTAEMREDQITITNKIDFSTSPEYALRGHQFGYRNTANSWDAWTVEQFDAHFREQIIFGANGFENIPFQDPESSVHFKVNPQVMEVEMSKICDKYDVDYWAWTPAPHDLTIKNAHQEGLKEQEAFFAKCPRLDGLFVPGGDPGENHPSHLIPYLKDLSVILHKYHPDAGIWVSLQGFNEEKVKYFFNYLEEESPDWLKGLVYGPSSPPIDLEREHLPKKYMHRSYPDITHTLRCSYPVERWDQAFALTLGREPCNPLPLAYAKIHNRDAIYTDGFISYSDGSHDDVNKVLWSQMGWDSNNDVRTIMVEYCRFFFGPDVAEEAADGIFALEQNWVGPTLGNKVIGETLTSWKKMEKENPQLAKNWRWQQLVMRAYYDAYVQDRLTYEKNLEMEAYKILAQANKIGADKAMNEALIYVQKADSEFVSQDLKEKVFQYAEDLFQSIGAQTSVSKYNARSAERGAILDFIDYPLNNRWWLEDEFKKISTLKTEEEKLAKLEFIRTYENPGEGSFYDNISSADAKHVTSETDDAIDYLWENNGLSRKRLSTQLFQFTPVLEYDELDPNTDYLIRVSGYGEALLRANGVRLKPTKYEKGFEQFKEFPLPKNLIKDGKLKITFDKPDEEHLNWRKQSRVTDVWILKQLFPLKGIVTVLNTPFTKYDTIDHKALKQNVNEALKAGVAGFLVPAMASEVYKLSDNEKFKMVETVLETAGDRVPVIAGAGETELLKSKKILRSYIDIGCENVLFQIPFKNEEQFRKYFLELAALDPKMIMLQDWDASGYGLEDELIIDLFENVEAFRCLKIETVPAGVKYSKILKLTGGKLNISGGWAVSQMIEGLQRGVHAFMPTGMHFIYTSIYRLFEEGKPEEAEKLFQKILPVLTFSNQHLDISIHFFKRLLFRQGIYPTLNVRQPILPFDKMHQEIADKHIDLILDLEKEIKEG